MQDNEMIVSYQGLIQEWMEVRPERREEFVEVFLYRASRFVEGGMEVARDDRAVEAMTRLLGKLEFQAFSMEDGNKDREWLLGIAEMLWSHDFVGKQDLAIIRSLGRQTLLDRIIQLQEREKNIKSEKIDKMKKNWQQCIGFTPTDLWDWLANRNIQHEKIQYLFKYSLIFKSQIPLRVRQSAYFERLKKILQGDEPIREEQSDIETMLREFARKNSYYMELKESINGNSGENRQSQSYYEEVSSSFFEKENILVFCSLIQMWATCSDIINNRQPGSGMSIQGVGTMSLFYLMQTKQITFYVSMEHTRRQEDIMLPLQVNFLRFLRFYREKGDFRRKKMMASLVKDPPAQFYRDDLIINIYDRDLRSNIGRMTKRYEQLFNYQFLRAERALHSKDNGQIQTIFRRL